MKTSAQDDLRRRLIEMEAENEELRNTLDAIRSGEVDALVFGDDNDQRVFTLRGAEQTYRDLVEAMNEGAVTLSRQGLILYCNSSFAEIAGCPMEKVIGSMITSFFEEKSSGVIAKALSTFDEKSVSVEASLKTSLPGAMRVLLSLTRIQVGDAPGFCMVVTDITERLETLNRLREMNETLEERVESRTHDLSQALKRYQASEDQFRSLADSIPTLAWMAHPSGEIFWFNRRWYEYTGVSEEELRGDGWAKLHDPQVLPSVIAAWRHSISTRTPFEMIFPLRGANGAYRAFLTRVIPVFDVAGVVVKWFGTNTDIESTIESKRVVEAAKEQAERANETKSAFLANMSHEIRTPLGAILGYTDLLRERNLPVDDRNQFLDTISRNGKSLIRIIDDILDLAKVESGKLEVENIEFSFFSLIDEIMDLFRERAKAQGIYIRAQIGHSVPDRIMSDPARLRQILINLVGNAVKFTQAGGVMIGIEYARKDSGSEFEVAVKDTGIGLTAEQKVKLFVPFTQADNSTSRKYGGTGLGLTLSKRLASALGGDVYISECKAEKGCTFVLTFVAALPATPESVLPKMRTDRVRAMNPSQVLSGLKLLLADDSIDNQFLIERVLTKQGADVEIASNGLEAFRKGMTNEFDLILMDIQMPEMDGYSSTRALRDAGFRKPIIALTAHAMAEERTKTREAGCDAHLTKPLNTRELLETIQRFARSQTDVQL